MIRVQSRDEDLFGKRKMTMPQLILGQPVYFTGKEQEYLKQVLAAGICVGNGPFGQQCCAALEKLTGSATVLLTPSCTAALEMAALLCGVGPGDEVIMPSFTFSSTANAFVLRGATPVFVDIDPSTMNIDPACIRQAITAKTKAIVPVHYAGVACDMDAITAMAAEHGLLVIEDAAQGIISGYKGRALGTIGQLGCMSFHESKNIQCGEGGALLINDPRFVEQAMILQEKGTNRAAFFQGMVDKYTWVDHGSSYLLSELNAAVLLAQLEAARDITRDRRRVYDYYHHSLKALADEKRLALPVVPEGCEGNGHIFYIVTASLQERIALMQHLKERHILAFFHYVPLHSSPAGQRFGRTAGAMRHTDAAFERLLRLPVYVNMAEKEMDTVCNAIHDFYKA